MTFSFDNEKVLKLTTFYPFEFSSSDLMTLDCQLDTFISDVEFPFNETC